MSDRLQPRWDLIQRGTICHVTLNHSLPVTTSPVEPSRAGPSQRRDIRIVSRSLLVLDTFSPSPAAGCKSPLSKCMSLCEEAGRIRCLCPNTQTQEPLLFFISMKIHRATRTENTGWCMIFFNNVEELPLHSLRLQHRCPH
ncbi:uncharacterized protein [Labrus bergylta]|uniref:uncharacterized protein n=1 Tax=Labrus bergylta TaxID=56723 RepID=UPI003313F277